MRVSTPPRVQPYHRPVSRLRHGLFRIRELLGLGPRLAQIAASASGLTDDRALRGPLYAQISVSDPCNQRCVMCPYHPPSERGPRPEAFSGAAPGLMDDATLLRVLGELEALGTRHVDFVGRGEPLLHPRLLDHLGEAVRRGFRVGLTTNGTRLSGRAAALSAIGLAHVRISLDAATAETYGRMHVGEDAATYRDVLSGAARLAAAPAPRPHVSFSFTVCAPNVHELEAVVRVAAQRGVDGVFFHHLLPSTADARGAQLDAEGLATLERLLPRAMKTAEALGVETNLGALRESRPPYRIEGVAPSKAGPEVPVPCYVGSYFTSILGNGRVAPCCQTRASLGSLKEVSFTEIWNGDAYRGFRRAARALPVPAPELSTSDCDRCYLRPHNLTIHRALHPFAREERRAEPLVSVADLLRRRRLEKTVRA